MRLGVDVGGTFTDLLLHDETTQRTWQAKTPSTPEDQSIGVAAGVKLICEKAGIAPSDLALVLHGTTVATNAVLEGKGARVGLLVTQGFEYTLHLAKSWTPGPLFGWIVMDKPEPLASLADTRGIPERMNARGEVVRELHLGGAGGHHLQWRATLARRDRVVVRPRAGREGGEPGFLDLRDQTAGPCDRDVVAGLTSGACEREQGRQVTETSDERDEQAHGVAA